LPPPSKGELKQYEGVEIPDHARADEYRKKIEANADYVEFKRRIQKKNDVELKQTLTKASLFQDKNGIFSGAAVNERKKVICQKKFGEWLPNDLDLRV
jgi:hypothetical protein